jgi:hypothetical protein
MAGFQGSQTRVAAVFHASQAGIAASMVLSFFCLASFCHAIMLQELRATGTVVVVDDEDEL